MGNTVVGMVTNTKIWYDCPGCGARVWAYPGFEGNRCWNCPGTLLQGTGRAICAAGGSHPIATKISDKITLTTVDTAIKVAKIGAEVEAKVNVNIDTTIKDMVTNNQRCYTCPHCGAEKWAFGMLTGTTCWKCGGILTVLDATRKIAVDNTIVPAANGVAKHFFDEPEAFNSQNAEPKNLNDIDDCKIGNLKIKSVKIQSIWLYAPKKLGKAGHLVSVIGSAASGTLTNHSVTHQWVSIETEKSNVWFNCQFYGKHLSALKCSSEDQVTEKGKEHVSEPGKDVTTRKEFNPSNKYMRDVLWFMKQYDGKYNLQDNNCQTFARGLCDYLQR